MTICDRMKTVRSNNEAVAMQTTTTDIERFIRKNIISRYNNLAFAGEDASDWDGGGFEDFFIPELYPAS